MATIGTVKNKTIKRQAYVVVIVHGKIVAKFKYPNSTRSDEALQKYKDARMNASWYCTKNNLSERSF